MLRQCGLLRQLALVCMILLATSVACSHNDEAAVDSDAESSTTDSEAGEDADSEKKRARKKNKKNGEEEEEEDEEEAVPIEVVDLRRWRIETVLRFSTNLEGSRGGHNT